MKIEIDINKLSQGILVINTDGEDKVEVNNTSVPVKPENKAPENTAKTEAVKEGKIIHSLPNYASASRIRQEFINLGKRYNNGTFSAALVKAKFIKPIGNSKRFAPGQKWTESMGVVEEMTYSRGGSNGCKYILAYNTKHPVIRNILNNIWFNSLDLTKKVKE